MNNQTEMTLDACLVWMDHLEILWELDAQFEEAERRWRHITCLPQGCADPDKRREISEARQCYQEAGLAFYLAANGDLRQTPYP